MIPYKNVPAPSQKGMEAHVMQQTLSSKVFVGFFKTQKFGFFKISKFQKFQNCDFQNFQIFECCSTEMHLTSRKMKSTAKDCRFFIIRTNSRSVPIFVRIGARLGAWRYIPLGFRGSVTLTPEAALTGHSVSPLL